MKHLLTIAIMLAAAALAACTTGQVTSAVDTACNDLPYAQAGFLTFATFKPQSAAVMRKEQIAYDAASAACATRKADTMTKINAALAIMREIQGS